MHRDTFYPSRFAAKRRFIEYKEPEPIQLNPEIIDEPIMQDKKQIIEDREVLKEKNKKQRDKMIPGAKLLLKLHKKQRLEDSLIRVVKNLSINH